MNDPITRNIPDKWKLTTKQLNGALSVCDFDTLSEDDAEIIVDQVNNMTNSKNEAAMFLAQLFHESEGFRYDREHNGEYQSYAPYYGRGYIQLTHDYNYRDASWDFYGDRKLLDNPDLVSGVRMSMRVSVWFWKERVRRAGGPERNNFGLTTKAINGALDPPGSEKARNRYRHYVKVAKVLGVTDLANEDY